MHLTVKEEIELLIAFIFQDRRSADPQTHVFQHVEIALNT
jgi:hypothetical protein